MKKILSLISILLFTSLMYAQKLPKVKGDKNVILSERKFDTVKALTIYGQIKLNVIQSDSCKLVINADENLHEIVSTSLDNGSLSIDLSKRIIRKKHFELIFYIDSLSAITLMGRSSVEFSGLFKTDSLQIELNDNSKLNNLNTEANYNIITTYDNSKIEIKTNTTSIKLKTYDSSKVFLNNSKSDSIYIAASDKSKITISGTTSKMSIEANDSSHVETKECIATNIFVACSESSIVSTLSKETLHIKASQKSKIDSYGKGEIIIEKFKDNAILRKKE